MSRKHYTEVAEMLNQQRQKSNAAEAWRVSEIALELALIFKRDNARFNAGKFRPKLYGRDALQGRERPDDLSRARYAKGLSDAD